MTPTEQEGGKPMTNYNEKLDKILNWQQRMFLVEALIQDISDTHKLEITDDIMNKYRDEAKQAITSLIKELVAEVIGEDEWSGIFPAIGEPSAMRDDLRADQRTRLQSILKREFEQNLLKGLEEV